MLRREAAVGRGSLREGVLSQTHLGCAGLIGLRADIRPPGASGQEPAGHSRP